MLRQEGEREKPHEEPGLPHPEHAGRWGAAQAEWVAHVRAVLRAVDRAWRAVAVHTGLGLPELLTLELLHFDGLIPIKALREHTGLTASAVSSMIDRLERAGLAQRVRRDSDRRKLHLELTEQGHRHVRHLFDPLIDRASPTERPTANQSATIHTLIELFDKITVLAPNLALPPTHTD